MQFSYHALERIIKGDENGLRTVLSPDEVMAILTSSLVVPSKFGYVFYSIRDEKCLEAIVDREKVVTIQPAKRVPFTMRLLAERKMCGDTVLIQDMPPFPKTTTRESAALIAVIYKGTLISEVEEVFLTWLDFTVDIFRYKYFLNILTDCIDANFSNTMRGVYGSAVLSLRGMGWRYDEPLSLPYELLGKQPPRS